MNLIRNYSENPVLAELEAAFDGVKCPTVPKLSILTSGLDYIVKGAREAVQRTEIIPRLVDEFFEAVVIHEIDMLGVMSSELAYKDSLKRLAGAILAVGVRYDEVLDSTAVRSVMRHNMVAAAIHLSRHAEVLSPTPTTTPYDALVDTAIKTKVEWLKNWLRDYTWRFDGVDYPMPPRVASREFANAPQDRRTPERLIEVLAKRRPGAGGRPDMVVSLIRSVDWLRVCVADLIGYDHTLIAADKREDTDVKLLRALTGNQPDVDLARVTQANDREQQQLEQILAGHFAAVAAVKAAAESTAELLKDALQADPRLSRFEARCSRLYCLLANEMLVCAANALRASRDVKYVARPRLNHLTKQMDLDGAKALAAKFTAQ